MDNKMNGMMIILISIFCFTIGLLFQRFILNQDFRVSYISQGELIELEKKRLAQTNTKELFYGEPEKAIEVIKDVQNKRTKKNHLVLFSEKRVFGRNVKSISREVHTEISKKLEKSK